jgi:hypothetical protein
MKVIYDTKSQIVGDTGENNFVKACLKRGWVKPSPSDEKQNRYEHWDFKLSNGSKVDVKGCKRLNRHDEESRSDIIYIEFVGIVGYKGWVYGESDIIAFETESEFILISTKRLQKISRKLISREFTRTPKLYKSYSRSSRPLERVGLLHIDDILKEDNYVLTK